MIIRTNKKYKKINGCNKNLNNLTKKMKNNKISIVLHLIIFNLKKIKYKFLF